jgi:hypothetical protein
VALSSTVQKTFAYRHLVHPRCTAMMNSCQTVLGLQLAVHLAAVTYVLQLSLLYDQDLDPEHAMHSAALYSTALHSTAQCSLMGLMGLGGCRWGLNRWGVKKEGFVRPHVKG